MKIFLLSILVIIIIKIIYRLTHNNLQVFPHILTRDDSNTLKGIMILCVISCHMGIALANEIPMSGYLASIGTPAVSVFLFLSGYGLIKSYKQKGESYLTCFFRTRFVKIIVPFLITSILSFLVDYYLGNFSFSYYYKGFLTGFPPLPNSWYIYALLLLYLFYYFTFRNNKETKKSIFFVFIMTVVLYSLFKYLGWAAFWYSSLLCFPIGLFFGEYDMLVEDHITRYQHVTISSLFFVSLILLFLFCKNNIPENIDSFVGFISMLFIPISIAIVTMSISSTGLKLLKFLGLHSYSLYLVHGLILELLNSMNLGCAVYIPMLIALSVLSAFVLEFVSGRLITSLIFSAEK